MTEPLMQHELIRASAGAGKTYELTNRFLRLLRMGEPPDEILASTFTRKAAGEILGRVLLRLAQAATDPERLAELQTVLSGTPLTHNECLDLLLQAARRLHRLRIGTLDSFFAQLAGSFALEIGLPPGWRIATEHEDASLRAQAIEAVLDAEDPSRLLTLVHALSRGETVRSLEHEVRDKVDTLYAVYRESSRDAWHRVPRTRELTETQLVAAIETLRAVPLPQHKTWERTRNQDVERAEAANWTDFVASGLAGKVAAGESTYCTKSIDMAVAAAYSALIEHAKAVLVNQLAAQTEATYELLDRFHRQYQLLKRQSRSLRFEDITVQLAERLMASPAAAGESTRSGYERLVFRLDAQLHHLLLDEFQDTSLAQWAVIKPFATRIAGAEHHTDRSKAVRSVTAVKGRSREKGQRSQIGQRPVFQSFFCVGDTKQAIYGWRGGVAEIFDAVTHELAGIQQRPLDTSWRSSPHVIRAVNEIFGNLQRHGNLGDLGDAVSSWQRQFNEHQTAPSRQKLNGYVCLQAARQPDDEEAESQNDITLRFAAQQVAEWKARAPGFDVGVLVRRNVAVRRLIYELRELGIEASEEGGSSLTDSAAVRLVLSLVRLADHPGDLVARFHIATSPLADPLGLLADVASDEQAPDSAGRVHQAAVPFAARQGDVAAGRLARQLRRRLVEEGYGPTVDFLARQLAPACSRRESRRLEKLIGLAYQYDDAATSRPSDFAAFVDASKVRDPIAADVRVMTVHQAKGLEFDIVVLTELEANLIGQRSDLVVGRPAPTQPIDRVCRRCHKALQELLPESWQALFREADEQDVAESLCVLYVAVTRARHALQMIVAPSADNEKSLHKAFGGLLRAALTDGRPLAPRQLAYETGDPQWYRNPGVERQPSAGTVALQAESLVPLEVCLAAARDRRWRGLQRVSPSGLEGGTHVRLADVRSAGSGDRAAALAYGTLIHAWFQQIRWLDDGPPDEQRLREVAAELSDLALSRADIDQRLIEFQAMLDNPDMAACLRRSRYGAWTGATPNVETERPIAVREGNRLLVGSIDRLVTIFRGSQPVAAEIMDFKTDALAGADERAVEAKVNFYRPQLSAYRLAVCTIFGLEPHQVSAKLLFVGTGTMADV